MEKYVESNIKTQIKQLINMQHLLTEYDRQNKFLNRQVLQLLQENKNLKLDKIKTNFLFRSNEKKQNKPSEKLHKQKSNYLFQKQRQKTQITPFTDHKTLIKIDEVMQTQPLKTKPIVCQINNHISLKQKETKPEINVMEVSRKLQSSKIQNKPAQLKQNSIGPQHKIRHKTMENISTREDQIHKNMFTKASIEQVKFSSKQNVVKTVQSQQFDPFQEISLRRQKYQANRKHNRSNHAIEPSRKITPASSEKKLLLQPETSDKSPLKKMTIFSSKKNQSQQKKRRFLMILSKRESLSKAKLETQKQGCC